MSEKRISTLFRKPRISLWREPSPQAKPTTAIPRLIHHEGTNYHVLPEAELTRLKGFGWPDLGCYAIGGALVGLAGGMVIGGMRTPTVVTVDKLVPVEKQVVVDRPVPVSNNCLIFCK